MKPSIVNTLCVLLGLLLAAVLGAGAGNHISVKTCDDFASLAPRELEGIVYFDNSIIICETPVVSPVRCAAPVSR